MNKYIDHLFSSIHQYGLSYIAAGFWNTLPGLGLYALLLIIYGHKHYLILGAFTHIAAVTNVFFVLQVFWIQDKRRFLERVF